MGEVTDGPGLPACQVLGPGRVEFFVDLLFLRCLAQLLVFREGHDHRDYLAAAADHVVGVTGRQFAHEVMVTTPADSRSPQHGGPAEGSRSDHPLAALCHEPIVPRAWHEGSCAHVAERPVYCQAVGRLSMLRS